MSMVERYSLERPENSFMCKALFSGCSKDQNGERRPRLMSALLHRRMPEPSSLSAKR